MIPANCDPFGPLLDSRHVVECQKKTAHVGKVGVVSGPIIMSCRIDRSGSCYKVVYLVPGTRYQVPGPNYQVVVVHWAHPSGLYFHMYDT